MAVRVGFEPTVAINHTRFPGEHLRPLGHPTIIISSCKWWRWAVLPRRPQHFQYKVIHKLISFISPN